MENQIEGEEKENNEREEWERKWFMRAMEWEGRDIVVEKIGVINKYYMEARREEQWQ